MNRKHLTIKSFGSLFSYLIYTILSISLFVLRLLSRKIFFEMHLFLRLMVLLSLLLFDHDLVIHYYFKLCRRAAATESESS